MRFKRPLLTCSVFLLALMLLRQGIMLMDASFPDFHRQSALIHEHDIDPAALFYTESPLALQAEKQVRRQISSGQGN